MAKRITLFILTFLALGILLVQLVGCATRTTPAATDPVPIAGYLGLQEEFGNLDFSSLGNRSIVIDPGHGGFYRGALGPEGLTEAEVNLGVALYLRGLLEWAGAQVHLTRTADYDFLTPADSTLAGDLAFRSSFTDSLQPDIFLSIHHNSTASKDPDINETQTYYPLGDDGASLDLARSIHRHLVLNLEITPAKILPGNFHVLRHAKVPAVLGEPSMISNPVMEGRLSLAASHELEAQAYFLGLLDYFSAGQPRWSANDTLLVTQKFDSVMVHKEFLSASVGHPQGPGPDPSSFHLTLNGVPQGFNLSLDGRRVTWRASDAIAPGTSILRLTGRNLKGRATPVSETVIIHEPNADITVTYSTESTQDNPNPRTMIFWQTQSGGPARGGFLTVNETHHLLLPPRPQGWFLLPEDIGPDPKFEVRMSANTKPLSVPASPGPHIPAHYNWRLLTLGEEPVFASSLMPPQGWHFRLGPLGIGFGTSMVSGGSPVFAWVEGPPIWIEAKGVLPLLHPGNLRIERANTFSPETAIIRPRLLLPQLFGKTIILDPAGGGTQTNGLYPLGGRGADLNLETARQVQLHLEGAGAKVLLTRQGEVAPDPQQKVLLASQQNADLFLTIGRAMPGQQVKVQHHPGSRVGVRWARAMTQAMAPMGSLQMGTSYAYLLRHTACPALELQLQAPQDANQEMLMTSPAFSQAEARAIVLACATALSGTDELPASANPVFILNQLSKQTNPMALPSPQWARWDGNFHWLKPSFQESSAAVGSWETTGWPAVSEMHTLEIHSGSQWQMWRVNLDSDFPENPHFQLMMENR